MKTHLPRFTLLLGLSAGALAAATTTIDFSGTQYDDSFTETINGGNLTIDADNSTLRVNHGSSLAGITTYNTTFPSAANTDDFTIAVDGKFSVLTGGGDSVGIITHSTGTAGYTAIFRFISATTVDFRLFEGLNASTGSLGTNLVNPSASVALTAAASETLVADKFYTFKLDVNVTSPTNVIFSASVLDATSGSIIASFTDVTDTSASLGGTSNKIGLRLGTNGNVNNYTTVDNLQLITSTIPEPSSFALLGGLGALGLVLSRRRR
jgi:hypothetical protein